MSSLTKTVISLLLIVLAKPCFAQYERVYYTADFDFFSAKEQDEFIQKLDSLFSDELKDLQKKINYYTNTKLQIFISARESIKEAQTFKQVLDVPGEVQISNTRVIINPNRSLENIRLQFNEQVAKILVEQLMFGSALQDKIKSSNMINFPDWFLQGLYLYLSRGWDAYCDNQLRQVYDNYGLTDFNNIPLAYSAIKGASFWNYIKSAYGTNSISVLLYNVRISPKFSAAIYYSYQVSLFDIYEDWTGFYKNAYQNDRKIPNPVQGIAKKRSTLLDLFVVSTQEYLTVEEYLLGKGVFKYLSDGRREHLYLLKGEEAFDLKFNQNLIVQDQTVYILCRVGDYSRLIEVKPSGKINKHDFPFYVNCIVGSANQLLIVSPGVDKSTVYSFNEGDLIEENQVDGYINSIDSKYGIIVYLTSLNGVSMLCTSDVQKKHSPRIVFKSKTKLRQVIIADEKTYLYNSLSSGIWNGKLWSEREGVEKSLTNYRSNILFHQYSDSVFVEYLDQGLTSNLLITEHIAVSDFYIYDTISPSYFHSQRYEVKTIEDSLSQEENDSLLEYSFISPVPPILDFTTLNYDSLGDNQRNKTDSINVDVIVRDMYKPYSVHLKLSNNPFLRDEVIYEENISLLTPNRIIINLGGTMANLSENRKFGFQYGGLLRQGTRDLLFKYSNRGKHFENISFLNRRRIEFAEAKRTAFNTSVLSINQRRYIGKRLWLNIGVSGRYDLNNPLLVSEESLTYVAIENTTISINTTLNFRPEKGKHKFDLQASLRPMIQNELSNWNVTSQLKFTYRNLISEKLRLTSRTKIGTSQGSSPVYFVLGGHHNDLRTNFIDRDFSDYKTPIKYHSIFGVRGFDLNYRNGNTFIVHTTEFSTKPLDYIFKRPIASEVFSNLAVHSFIDVGTSFYGKSIYDRPNLLNTRNISSSTQVIRTEVRAFKNPLIFSTGVGLSSRFYGYNISIDYAWGYEDQAFRSPFLHIGLGSRF